MANIEINNEFELGNAIWTSKAGDTIVLKNGNYGLLPFKDGVNYDFQGATVASILELEKFLDSD